MQRLHYMGETMLMADAVCTALLEYASALGGKGLADVVTVPILDEASIPTVAEMLIGPASQLYATPVDSLHQLDLLRTDLIAQGYLQSSTHEEVKR